MTKVMPLEAAVRAHVQAGMHIHFASTPSRSNASIREVARVFQGRDPRFVVSSTGFHSTAHLLPLLGLGRRYIACFFGDNYPAPRPNPLYTELARRGTPLEHWSLWSYVSALRAGALGHACAVTRSLAGTTLGDELGAAGKFASAPDPFSRGGSIGLVAAMRPDITFIHAAWGDPDGHVTSPAPHGEGFWGALGAKRGVIVTVEQIVDGALVRRAPDAIRVPPDRVLAVCVEPFGAHPQPLFASPRLSAPAYQDDFEHYELWRAMSLDPGALARFVERVLGPSGGGDAYRAFVGVERLEALRRSFTEAPAESPPLSAGGDLARPQAPAPESPALRLVLGAARQITSVVREKGYRRVLAGIGHSFLAARIAKQWLREQGLHVDVLVETGMLDIACGPEADDFLLSFDTMAMARRLSSAEEALGALTCGADNRCLGVIGAAQIDPRGDVNSTRLRDGRVLVGSGGASDIASSAAETIVLTLSGRERIVPRVDYITSPGRRVELVVTDLCTLRRDAPSSESWTSVDLIPSDERRELSEALAELRARCAWPINAGPSTRFAAPFSAKERQAYAALGGPRRRRAEAG